MLSGLNPDFASVFLIVVKIGGGHDSILIANQAVGTRPLRIELDLDLHILGDRHQIAGQLLDHLSMRFAARVDKGVDAIASIRNLLHHGVVRIAHAVTEHRQKNLALGILSYHFNQGLGARDADVEVAVRAQDHAVDASSNKIIAGQIVSQLNTLAAIGGTAGVQIADGLQDQFLFVAACPLQYATCRTGIDGHRNFVILAQLFDEHPHRLFH